MKTWSEYEAELRRWFTDEVVPGVPHRQAGKWSTACGLDKPDKAGVPSYKVFSGLQVNGATQWKIEHLYKICVKLSEQNPEITPAHVLDKIERRLLSRPK